MIFMIPAAFVVLLGAGIYLEKLTWVQALQWFLVAGSLCLIAYRAANSIIAPVVVLLVCDAVLVLVVLELDPVVRGRFPRQF